MKAIASRMHFIQAICYSLPTPSFGAWAGDGVQTHGPGALPGTGRGSPLSQAGRNSDRAATGTPGPARHARQG